MAQIYDQLKVLICLCEYRCKDGYARISQQEVAEKVQLSRVTVNKHFQELISAKYIIPDTKYLSKYYVADKALSLAKRMKRTIKNTGKTT